MRNYNEAWGRTYLELNEKITRLQLGGLSMADIAEIAKISPELLAAFTSRYSIKRTLLTDMLDIKRKIKAANL